jgi:hypothetical protein
MACLQKTKATAMETNPDERVGSRASGGPQGARRSEPVGLRKRHRGQNLAAEHRQKPKERARGNCEALNWPPPA